ncbi:uncharacterized protein LOC108719503 [Xenopus laevis]|uniref:Uncharacterized protein LOC108719503 n=2 Tax=Xenopus laevis TaxID=8355 RepID=A0A1L8FUA1_XENLA|nr:uncharacterized protein LOC108719503 [Xenopus laevis]XP_041422763.1 uncharacterized protein LOC108719503 [Xenopus laevis]OCT75164.1 hypothetical protein XELAEV_18030337mg [Xenopus laevis]
MMSYNLSSDKEDDVTIEVAALGHQFSLGMLYDICNDKLVPGVTLRNQKYLNKEMVSTTYNEKISFEMIPSDCLSDKFSAMNISASLKASFLAGLVDVSGSASYLNDTKTSKHQARVTLKYSRTTRFEHLSMDHLGIKNVTYRDVFDKGTATHVVTGIVYGTQTFLVLDSESATAEDLQNAYDTLHELITKLHTVSAEQREEDLKVNEKEIEILDKFTCTFYGDFAFDTKRVTCKDAIDICTKLPRLFGKNEEKAVPVRVWLYPLSKLDRKAQRLVQEISENVIDRAEQIIEHVTEVNIQCNDLINHLTAITFPDYKQQFIQFKELWEKHKTTFQKELAQTLPLVRRGALEEAELARIIDRWEQSPFGKAHSEDFLSNTLQEMDFIKSYLQMFPNVMVLSSQYNMRAVLSDPKIQYLICYNFNLLEAPCLPNMVSWLKKKQNKPSHDVYVCGKETPWFKEEEASKKGLKYAAAFQELVCNNKDNEQTGFAISATWDPHNVGISIHLYKAGMLVSSMFEPPAKPKTPSISSKTHESIKITMRPDDFGKEFITGYFIEYKQDGEVSWSGLRTDSTDQNVTIMGLNPNTGYQFRYNAECIAGISAVSEITKGKTTFPTGPPKNIKAVSIQHTISLSWKEPSVIRNGVLVTEYRVEWKEATQTQGWSNTRTGRKVEDFIIKGLSPMTLYKVRVSAVCGTFGTSAPCEDIEIFTESSCIKHQFLKRSSKLIEGPPSVFQLNTDIWNTKYRKYNLGKRKLYGQNKVILLVGAVGSGKTTLINGMCNYILGVDWEDDYRFKLVHEVTNQSEAHSQTSDVTAYVINHNEEYRIPYSLTLIDTPGFGEQDKKITQDIETFLCDNGIDQIDAVCFVVQSYLTRLTPSQKYIFNSFLSVFGKDIRDNIRILINFSDGLRAPVLDAIKSTDIPFPLGNDGDPIHFKFNNSLFSKNQSSELCFDKMFWTSMEAFFTSVGRMETKNLRRTMKQLEVNLQTLQPQIKTGLVKIEEIDKTESSLQQNKALVTANKNFEYEVEIAVPIKQEIQKDFITYCQQCHFTCHSPCTIADDNQKMNCASMKNNYCTVCPGKCFWNFHSNQKYRWDYVYKKEKKAYHELKHKYEQVSGEVMTLENILAQLSEEYVDAKVVVMELIGRSSHSLNRLQEIAQTPKLLTITKYIDMMIKSEEQEAKLGYRSRIRYLREVRMDAELVEKTEKKEELPPSQDSHYVGGEHNTNCVIS